MTNKTIWKQYDSRWASKPYPKARISTVGGCGCGLLACTHIAMEQNRYKNWTPENLRPWMVSKGFAVTGQGTRWEGITETLKHIGHGNVVRIYNDPMSKAFRELNKGNRIGIILFNGNVSPNGTRWTSSGHYVAFTKYYVGKSGRHWFECKDSGGRNHSGTFSYEKSMKGCISKMWIVERLDAPKKKSATKKGEPKKEQTQGDKIAKTAESYIGKVKYVKGGRSLKTGCDCTGFVQAVHKKCGITLKVSDTWGKSVGKSTSKAKAGDVIYYYIGGKLHHMGIYVGNNKVVHNSTSHKDWHKDVCKSNVKMSGMTIGDIRRCWK